MFNIVDPAGLVVEADDVVQYDIVKKMSPPPRSVRVRDTVSALRVEATVKDAVVFRDASKKKESRC